MRICKLSMFAFRGGFFSPCDLNFQCRFDPKLFFRMQKNVEEEEEVFVLMNNDGEKVFREKSTTIDGTTQRGVLQGVLYCVYFFYLRVYLRVTLNVLASVGSSTFPERNDLFFCA